MSKMGAKDALCKIKDMHFGLPDTLGYYEMLNLVEANDSLLQHRQHPAPRGSSNRKGWHFVRVCVEGKDLARLLVGAQSN